MMEEKRGDSMVFSGIFTLGIIILIAVVVVGAVLLISKK